MKKYYFLISMMLFGLYVNSQPVLTQAGMAPIGFNYDAYIGPTMNPGSSGANQVWDFSSAAMTAAATVNTVDPATTPYFGTFPTSNYAYEFSILGGGEPMYNYYVLSSAALEKIGGDISSTTGEIYTDTRKDLEFPFTYGFSYTDNFAKTNGGFGFITETYDGYGTLITPFETFSNVVRIYKVWDGGEWEYQWWTSEDSRVVWSVKADQTVGYGHGTVGIAEQYPQEETMLSPNPTSSFFMIKSQNGRVARVEMLDMTGNIVLSLQGDVHRIDVNDLPTGIYMVRVQLENGKSFLQKLVVR